MKHPKTVRVKAPITDENPLGYVVINEADVTDEHELFEEAKAEEAPRSRPYSRTRR